MAVAAQARHASSSAPRRRLAVQDAKHRRWLLGAGQEPGGEVGERAFDRIASRKRDGAVIAVGEGSGAEGSIAAGDGGVIAAGRAWDRRGRRTNEGRMSHQNMSTL
jgi:hypothetical protein